MNASASTQQVEDRANVVELTHRPALHNNEINEYGYTRKDFIHMISSNNSKDIPFFKGGTIHDLNEWIGRLRRHFRIYGVGPTSADVLPADDTKRTLWAV